VNAFSDGSDCFFYAAPDRPAMVMMFLRGVLQLKRVAGYYGREFSKNIDRWHEF